MFAFVAGKLNKTKNGTPSGDAPTAASVKEFFEKVDADADWFPGKHSGEKRGPKRILRGAKLGAIVSAAKRLKSEGVEPTYGAIVAACPQATLNPATGEPVDKELIYTVFRESCYDGDPSDTWAHRARLSRKALTADAMSKRLAFATYMLTLHHTASWYFNNLVWCDLCNSVLPRTMKKAQEMALARKAGKGWGSKCSQQTSQNLRAPVAVLKMRSSDTVRVWWVPVLTHGKLHIEMLPDDFPGETEDGAGIMVSKVRSALNIRFQGSAPPRVLFTDRGNGFYNSGSGKITVGYSEALREHSLRAFFSVDASPQPGQLQEVMLHETAVAWMRNRLSKTLPRAPWDETVEAYRTRLKTCAAYCNDHYDVDGLSRALPKRVQMLSDRKGDRLPK